MPTTKKRLNITMSDSLDKDLAFLSERDNVSMSTKASELLKVAIEIEEDSILNQIAESRDKKEAKIISHKDVWS